MFETKSKLIKNQMREWKEKGKNRNTTPSLPVKTLALLGATRVMAVRSGATCDARVKLSEERGHVTNGRDCWGWEGGGGANHCRGCTRDRDDNGHVVMKRMGNTNDREWVIGSVSGRNCDRGIWHLRSWRLNVLVSGVGNHSGRRGKVRSTTCLNKKRLEAVDDIGGDELSKNVVSAVLKVLKSAFQGKDGGACSEVVSKTGYRSRLTSQEIFDMGNLSVRTNEWGESLGWIVNGKRIKGTIVEGVSRGHNA